MSLSDDPFNPKVRLRSACSCGRHASQDEHEQSSGDELGARVVEQAVMRALFPRDGLRRRFLSAVGSGTALAALSGVFPLGAAKEAFAQGGGKLEKTKLKVGFIPITCATPIIIWRTRWGSTPSRAWMSRW